MLALMTPLEDNFRSCLLLSLSLSMPLNRVTYRTFLLKLFLAFLKLNVRVWSSIADQYIVIRDFAI